MKISSVLGSLNPSTRKNNQLKKQTNTSFKGIFVNSGVTSTLLTVGKPRYSFLPRNALNLNKVSYSYPNQDCFITKGYEECPALLYRERPIDVPMYTDTPYREFSIKYDKEEEPYQPIPLLLYPIENYPNEDYFLSKYKYINLFIGQCSQVSVNPSLEYTVSAGYELHKKIIDKKRQIEKAIGDTNAKIDFGGPSILDKAHKAIEEIEIAVARFLLESAYPVLLNRAKTRDETGHNNLRMLTKLEMDREYDLTTSLAKQKEDAATSDKSVNNFDICDFSMKYYPNIQENKAKIRELAEYMRENELTLE